MVVKALIQGKKESDEDWVERLAREMSEFYKDVKIDSTDWSYEISSYKKRPMYLLKRDSQDTNKKIGF